MSSKSKPQHWSDCAVHSEPAYPAGDCDCGGYTPPLLEQLKNPDECFPENFDTPKRANALLASLCQEAAELIEAQQTKLDTLEENLDACASECLGLRNAINDMQQIINRLNKDNADLLSQGQRLAMLLEAICISSDWDNVAVSKYWNEAMEAIEAWRK